METGWQFVLTLPRSFEDSFAGQVWLQKDDDGTWSSNGSSVRTLLNRGNEWYVVMMTVGAGRFADGGARCDEREMVVCCSQPRPGKAEGERTGDGL